MPFLTRPQGQMGVNALHLTSDFRDDGSDATTTLSGGAVDLNNTGDGGNPYSPVEAVPNLFVAAPANESGSVWVGLGVTAPFGLSSQYKEGWFGRYDSTSSDLRVIDISPAVAFKPSERLTFGGGLNIQRVDADLRRAIPDPLEAGGPTPQRDGELILEGHSLAIGVNAGMIYKPWEHTRVAAHYRSEVNHRLTGNLKGRTPTGLGGGVNFLVTGEAALDLPQIATVALAQDIGSRMTVMAHAMWFGWDSFQEIRMALDNGGSLSDPQGYENSVTAALGAEYKASDRLTLRTGMQYDETPTTGDNRTTRTPDGNRIWVSGGLSYNITDRITADFAGTYMFIDEGHVDRTATFDPLYTLFGAPGAAATVNTQSTTESSVGILGMAVNYKF